MYYRNVTINTVRMILSLLYDKILTSRLIESTYGTRFDRTQDRTCAIRSAFNIVSTGQRLHTAGVTPPKYIQRHTTLFVLRSPTAAVSYAGDWTILTASKTSV